MQLTRSYCLIKGHRLTRESMIFLRGERRNLARLLRIWPRQRGRKKRRRRTERSKARRNSFSSVSKERNRWLRRRLKNLTPTISRTSIKKSLKKGNAS